MYNKFMFKYQKNDLDFAHKLDYTSLPLDDFKKHMHKTYELLYFVDGNATYTIENETKKLQMGDVLIIAPGVFHFGEVNLDKKYERFVLKFPIDVISKELFDEFINLKGFVGNYPELINSFLSLKRATEDYRERYIPIILCNELNRIIVNILNNKNENGEVNILKNKVVWKIIEFINQNIKKDISLEDIAKELSFSKSYISKEFISCMNVPIMTYIRYKKIILASQDIKNLGRTPSQVAEDYGFQEYSTFYRNYIKIIGKQPCASKQKHI